MRTRNVVVGLVVLGLAVAPGRLGAEGAERGSGRSFDGDLSADLAIGVPDNDGYYENVGVVNVLYGTWSAGLAFAGNQMWCLWVPGISEIPGAGDWYGAAVAVGDFNGDGFADLASGIPGRDLGPSGNLADAGAVHVVYGTADGLVVPGYDMLTQGFDEDENDQFGTALAAGDFNGDGYDDLAVSAPWEDIGIPAPWDAGLVFVFYGSTSGLEPSNYDILQQGSGSIGGWPESGDQFGRSLAAGELNGDAYDDLAIGVPSEDAGDVVDAGVFHVVYGNQDGLGTGFHQLWYENQVFGTITAGNLFGWALASGDFDGDGYGDMAVSAPARDVALLENSGVVYVIHGSAAGLTAQSGLTFCQDTPGVGDVVEPYDYFGASLAAGNLDGDRYDDLAIGVPYEDEGSLQNAGCVHVLYGSARSLEGVGSQLWGQSSGAIQGVAEAGDEFGYALAVGDFDADGYGDLAVGAPGELVGGSGSSGCVHVIRGSPAGLTDVDNQLWYQETASSWGTGGGLFGYALAAEPKSRAFVFADDFGDGSTSAWTSAVP